MKRTLLTVISVCLVLAAVFGIYAGVVGTDDISAIVRYTGNQRSSISEIADLTEMGIDKLEAEEEQHKQDILDATEGTLVDQIGSEELEQGEAEWSAGKDKLDAGQAQYNKGKKQYDEAKALYDEKYAQYEDACDQLADAKVQYAAGQEKLNDATPAYNAIKAYVNLADGKVYEYTKYLADPIAQSYGYSSAQAVVTAYEEGQQQLADASVQIADAEKQLADAKVQLDEGKAQLDDAEKQLKAAKAQLDSGKAQLDAARAELDEGHATVDASVEELEAAKEKLLAFAETEDQVKYGISQLMATQAIADKVDDESDYRSVIEATRAFIEETKDGVNEEMTVRQNLYTMLIAAAVVCALAGLIGLVSALNPSGGKLNFAMCAAVAAAVLTCGFFVYGLLNGSRSFAYYYMDTLGNISGDGSLQSAAYIVLVLFALCAVGITVACRNAYRKVLLGVEDEQPEEEEDKAVSEPVPVVKVEKAPEVPAKSGSKKKGGKKKAAPVSESGMTAEELAAETRRLNEEAERIEEANAQLDALKKAQQEYEEAKKRFEEARRSAEKH